MKGIRYHLACNLNLDLIQLSEDRHMSKEEAESWYVNNLQREEEKKDRLMMIKNYQNLVKNSDLTFTPRINQKYNLDKKRVSIQERASEIIGQRNHKREQQKLIIDRQKQDVEYSFHPKINKYRAFKTPQRKRRFLPKKDSMSREKKSALKGGRHGHTKSMYLLQLKKKFLGKSRPKRQKKSQNKGKKTTYLDNICSKIKDGDRLLANFKERRVIMRHGKTQQDEEVRQKVPVKIEKTQVQIPQLVEKVKNDNNEISLKEEMKEKQEMFERYASVEIQTRLFKVGQKYVQVSPQDFPKPITIQRVVSLSTQTDAPVQTNIVQPKQPEEIYADNNKCSTFDESMESIRKLSSQINLILNSEQIIKNPRLPSKAKKELDKELTRIIDDLQNVKKKLQLSKSVKKAKKANLVKLVRDQNSEKNSLQSARRSSKTLQIITETFDENNHQLTQQKTIDSILRNYRYQQPKQRRNTTNQMRPQVLSQYQKSKRDSLLHISQDTLKSFMFNAEQKRTNTKSDETEDNDDSSDSEESPTDSASGEITSQPFEKEIIEIKKQNIQKEGLFDFTE